MKLFTRVWTAVTTVVHWLTLSPLEEHGLSTGLQHPLGPISHGAGEIPAAGHHPHPHPPKSPLFRPPGSNIDGFKCDYNTNMGPGWYDCTTEYPGCWIRNSITKQVFDITQDYETVMPIGITRNYTLYVTDENTINVDGIPFTQAKLFNNVFPGPLLEACWGDTVSVTVVNNMKWNGTSIHWHGIRQNQTMHMDGVNGITQCPIAPGQSFTYVWNATQYGSSWYHSHYSVQYADGLQGPITIHGPTSVDYDEAVIPLLTSDWLHNTAFDAELSNNQSYPTILLNGTGDCARFYAKDVPPVCKTPPKGLFQYVFNSTLLPSKATRKYLLRIINTSYATAITFSIDNHNLTIVEADFVPTNPTTVSSILVSIGQRYHVIVEASSNPFAVEPNGNYWIRTNSSGCGDDITGNATGFERTGILRYNASSTADPGSKSVAWPGNQPNATEQCVDNLTMQLSPVYNWVVKPPKNGLSGEAFNINFGTFQPYQAAFVAFTPMQGPMKGGYYPFQTTYNNPTFLNLDNDEDSWPYGWMVIPENYTSYEFVYLVLQGGAHPIHLHGHDFAVVAYEPNKTFDASIPFTKTYYDLMRRDVILVPGGDVLPGYTVIAFKTDNPGAWLMHCHIAFHASGGLSLQIMERQAQANVIWPPNDSNALRNARKTCQGWNNWAYNCQNYWPGMQLYNKTQPPSSNNSYWPACGNVTQIQNDSGV